MEPPEKIALPMLCGFCPKAPSHTVMLYIGILIFKTFRFGFEIRVKL